MSRGDAAPCRACGDTRVVDAPGPGGVGSVRATCCACGDAAGDAVVRALAERDAARETARRLNRRAQWAEACATRALRWVRAANGRFGLDDNLRLRLHHAEHFARRYVEALTAAGASRIDARHYPDRAVATVATTTGLQHAVALTHERDTWQARYRLARRALAYAVAAGRWQHERWMRDRDEAFAAYGVMWERGEQLAALTIERDAARARCDALAAERDAALAEGGALHAELAWQDGELARVAGARAAAVATLAAVVAVLEADGGDPAAPVAAAACVIRERNAAAARADRLATTLRAVLAADPYRCDLERPSRAACGWCWRCVATKALDDGAPSSCGRCDVLAAALRTARSLVGPVANACESCPLPESEGGGSLVPDDATLDAWGEQLTAACTVIRAALDDDGAPGAGAEGE